MSFDFAINIVERLFSLVRTITMNMKSLKILILPFLLSSFSLYAQLPIRKLNLDSLYKVALQNLPEDRRKEFIDDYNSADEKGKEFLAFMAAMPRSSKAALTKNIDTNYKNIDNLKKEYYKLVPAHYIVSIEFNPPDHIMKDNENIDLCIISDKDNETTTTQDWGLDYHSAKLDSMLTMIGWNYETLKKIKSLLMAAHCVSVENGKVCTIGFARSGMGKYSYELFDKDLTADEIKRNNDDCDFIFYRNNIVLEYGGGAVGPQCFPDK
jgi:hypothetical protein